nr:immunoglobulin heavy chain junction region [Mus musculus]MBK4186344.1 immunoglobulin heavy chain junction region [Mus musculus]
CARSGANLYFDYW